MKNKGFTMVELVVTLVVLVVLMSVSIPIYKSKTNEFKKAEGYALLATIRSAQEKYYAEYGTFLLSGQESGGRRINYGGETITKAEVLGVNAGTNKYYRTFCINTIWPSQGQQGYRFRAEVYNSAVGGLYMDYSLSSGVTIGNV